MESEIETTTNETAPETVTTTETAPETSAPEASLRDILAARNAEPVADASLTSKTEESAPEEPAVGRDEELETLRAQVKFFEETLGDSVFQTASAEQKPVETTSADTESVSTTSADAANFLEAKAFELSDQEVEDITLNGSGEALRGVLKRQAEVIEHNASLKAQQNIAQAIQYALPTYLAAARFNERNPELAQMPNADRVIEKTLWGVRQANPQASDAQLLRLAEKQLRPAIDKAKQIVAKGSSAKKEVGASQQPTAVIPSARVNAATPRPSREVSTEDRVAELRAHFTALSA